MKRKEKTMLRISIAAPAAVAILDAQDKKAREIPGISRYLTKADLFPRAARRSGWTMESDYDPIYDEQAISPPDEKFYKDHWPKIREYAADNLRRYIIPDTNGVRLGTFSEYQEVNKSSLSPIMSGIVKSWNRRARIIRKQGGDAMDAEWKQKLLGSGKDENKDGDDGQ